MISDRFRHIWCSSKIFQSISKTMISFWCQIKLQAIHKPQEAALLIKLFYLQFENSSHFQWDDSTVHWLVVWLYSYLHYIPHLHYISCLLWYIVAIGTWKLCLPTCIFIIQVFFSSFCNHLPCYMYHWQMASIISQIIVVWGNRELSDGSFNWPRVNRRNLP